MNERNQNLDLLRVIATFMVVRLHVSAGYVQNNLQNPNIYFTIGNFFNSITRVSVPIFVMLSGAFVLDNPKNKEYRKFYNKTFKKIIKPTLIWSLIYFIYNILMQIVRQSLDSGINLSSIDFITPLNDWIHGSPFYHLWYMYMIIGLYAITPVLIRIKDDIGDDHTLKLGWFLILLGMIIKLTSTLYWPIMFILYLGYFVLGYSLKKYYLLNPSKSYKYALGSIISALLVFIFTEIIVRNKLMPNNQLFFYSNLTIFVVSGSICMFIAFLNIKSIHSYKLSGKLVKQSFYIYLTHAGILNILDFCKGEILPYWNPNPLFYIPLRSIFVFTLSYILSLIIQRVLNSIKKPYNFSYN